MSDFFKLIRLFISLFFLSGCAENVLGGQGLDDIFLAYVKESEHGKYQNDRFVSAWLELGEAERIILYSPDTEIVVARSVYREDEKYSISSPKGEVQCLFISPEKIIVLNGENAVQEISWLLSRNIETFPDELKAQLNILDAVLYLYEPRNDFESLRRGIVRDSKYFPGDMLSSVKETPLFLENQGGPTVKLDSAGNGWEMECFLWTKIFGFCHGSVRGTIVPFSISNIKLSELE